MNTGKIYRGIKVITVEDSPIVVDRVQSMLSEIKGIEYLGNASTIAATWNLFARQQPDVLIMDIHLADDALNGSGINLLIELRQKYPLLVIIMFTNLNEPQYRKTCLLLGANYFYDKSNDFEKIPDTLKYIMLNRESGFQKKDLVP